MTEWRFELTKEAEEDLEKLDSSVRDRILEKLKWFRENFEQVTPLPLGGKWRGFFKLRIGNYRVIYELEKIKKVVTIHCVDRRDKIYKRRKPKKSR
jgi:mRNA interferase RelE/StbE